MSDPPPRANATPPADDWLADLARRMGEESDLDAVWRRVVDASVRQVDGVEHAGITLLSRRSVSTPVFTGDLVRRVDELQYSIGEGPCLTAALDPEAVVRVDDLAGDERWPAFAEAAVAQGVRSMLSFQLYTAEETIGALNLYASSVSAFTDDAVRNGLLLASHAAVAAAAMSKNSNLRIAVDSRDVIGQAKGILMERYRVSAQHAFDMLIIASSHTNRKLRDVAADLADTGLLATEVSS